MPGRELSFAVRRLCKKRVKEKNENKKPLVTKINQITQKEMGINIKTKKGQLHVIEI